jgi:hypothetical protein
MLEASRFLKSIRAGDVKVKQDDVNEDSTPKDDEVPF